VIFASLYPDKEENNIRICLFFILFIRGWKPLLQYCTPSPALGRGNLKTNKKPLSSIPEERGDLLVILNHVPNPVPGSTQNLVFLSFPKTIVSKRAIGRPTLIANMAIYHGNVATQAKINRESISLILYPASYIMHPASACA
jgi:hypothetical protein